jgi:hypothetical protein
MTLFFFSPHRWINMVQPMYSQHNEYLKLRIIIIIIIIRYSYKSFFAWSRCHVPWLNPILNVTTGCASSPSLEVPG